MAEIGILDAKAYPLLANVADGYVPEPEHSIAVVATEGDRIVGRAFLLSMIHLEGTWVSPESRKGTIGARIVRRAQQQARKAGVKSLLAYAPNSDIEDYLKRLGFTKQPVTVWAKET